MACGEEHFRRLERMYNTAPINAFFQPVMEIGEGTARVAITVRKDFHHAANAVHGATYFKLLDDASFFAANSLVEDAFVVTVSFNLHFTRPVAEGRLEAIGRVVHQSRRLLIADAELLDDAGKLVARGTGTFMPSNIPLTPEIGYA